MSLVTIDNNNCLLINNNDFSKLSLHPQWLRERLSESEFIDINNKQRLYEPSLLNSNLKIQECSLNEDDLKILFSDGAQGVLSLKKLFGSWFQ